MNEGMLCINMGGDSKFSKTSHQDKGNGCEVTRLLTYV
jgi:hypothetical protein